MIAILGIVTEDRNPATLVRPSAAGKSAVERTRIPFDKGRACEPVYFRKPLDFRISLVFDCNTVFQHRWILRNREDA